MPLARVQIRTDIPRKESRAYDGKQCYSDWEVNKATL